MDKFFRPSLLIFLFFFYSFVYGQVSLPKYCRDALPFCATPLAPYTYPASTGDQSAEPGPCYPCGNSWPRPAWYFMMIDQPGTIIIDISSNPLHDIDFVCWGPFTSPTGACPDEYGNTQLTCANVVGCGWSSSGHEICTIPNTLHGQFYILLITNWVNQPTNITFYQSNYGELSAGTTTCNIVLECSLLSLTPTPTECNPLTNKFNVSGNIYFTNAPSSGTLTIADDISGIFEVFSAPFINPLPYNLNDITCDGAQHHLNAIFSADPNCALSESFNSPQPVCPVAVLSGGGLICDDGVQETSINIEFTVGIPPFDIQYKIGTGTPIQINNINETFYQLFTKTPGNYSLISVSNEIVPKNWTAT